MGHRAAHALRPEHARHCRGQRARRVSVPEATFPRSPPALHCLRTPTHRWALLVFFFPFRFRAARPGDRAGTMALLVSFADAHLLLRERRASTPAKFTKKHPVLAQATAAKRPVHKPTSRA